MTYERVEGIAEPVDQPSMGRFTFRYMAPPPEFVAKARLHHRSALIVGEMGSGKTTFVEARLGEVVSHLMEKHGVDESRICYAYAREAGVRQLLKVHRSMDVERCMYMYMFNDDAPASPGGHGRRAMTRENVSESQAYIMIRHRLRKMGFQGFMLTIHASQVYHLIDITFRRMAVLKMFKTYPDEPQDFRLIGLLVGSAGLSALFDISMDLWVSNDPRAAWRAVHSCVAVLKRAQAVVEARPGMDQVLRKLPNTVYIEPDEGLEDDDEDQNPAMEDYEVAVHVLNRLMRHLTVKPQGRKNILIRVNGKDVWILRDYLKSLQRLGVKINWYRSVPEDFAEGGAGAQGARGR